MEFRKQAHCIYHCLYHIVLPTKYRRQVFNNGVFAYFEFKLKEINKYYPEISLQVVNHDKDHVHFMVWIPPKFSISKVVGIIKANTSKGMKKKFDYLKKLYHGSDGIWSEGYCVSTVGVNEDIIRQYIENQGKEDTGQAKLELG